MTSRSYVCVVVGELELSNFGRQVGRSGHGLAAAGGGYYGIQVFTASMFTVLKLISLTIALGSGSARVTGLGSSLSIAYTVLRVFKFPA